MGPSTCGSLDSYKGLVFATFNPEAPPLRKYLGKVTWYLDVFFDRREGGVEVVGGMRKWVILCNWKFPTENFSGDAYHVPWSHLSAIRSGFSFGANTKPEAGGRIVFPGNGHAIVCVGPNYMGQHVAIALGLFGKCADLGHHMARPVDQLLRARNGNAPDRGDGHSGHPAGKLRRREACPGAYSDATNSLTAGKKSISLREEYPPRPEDLREINLLNAFWPTMPAAEFGAPKPGRQRTGRGIWPSPPTLPLTSSKNCHFN